jgi:hypothetical protein
VFSVYLTHAVPFNVTQRIWDNKPKVLCKSVARLVYHYVYIYNIQSATANKNVLLLS